MDLFFKDLKIGDKFIFKQHRFYKISPALWIDHANGYANYYNSVFREGPLKGKWLYLAGEDVVQDYNMPIDGIFEDGTGRFFKTVSVNNNNEFIHGYII